MEVVEWLLLLLLSTFGVPSILIVVVAVEKSDSDDFVGSNSWEERSK